MIDGAYAQQSTMDSHDSHKRREEYASQNYNPAPPSPTPFAFVPPPLASASASAPGSSRPLLSMHQPDQPSGQDYSSYYAQRAQPSPAAASGGGGNSSAYPSYSGSMGYRTGETARAPPPAPLPRVPSYTVMSQGGQPSPTATSPGYFMPSSARAAGQPYSAQHSPRNAVYSQQGYYAPASPYGQAQAVEMPRSLTYPNAYSSAPYSSYLPTMSTPQLVHPDGLPHLMRHNSSASLQAPPPPGAFYGNRLSLNDRPYKCDQCVQSFNRNHDLKRHKRIHLSVKPYGCEKCGKTFSRKDALRRHWMVRGCRGEEGATAPITPNYPLNGPPPALSPNSPPNGSGSPEAQNGKSSAQGYGSNTMSFSHPAAPPPLSSLPPRQPSDQPSQIILTPNEVAAQQRASANGGGSGSPTGPLDGVLIDPQLSGLDSMSSARTTSNESDSYFEGMRKSSIGTVPDSATSSTFSRYAASPKDEVRHHPYTRRALPSPSTHGPPSMGSDMKPSFNMSFSSQQNSSLLAPIGSEEMSKEASTDSADLTWGRGWA